MINDPGSKLPEVGTTIFSVMSALAEQHGAINLSQGFPDFEPPEALRDRVSHHMAHGHNQYPPMTGIAPLREQIAAKMVSLYGCEVDPATEVTVTSGATEALFCAIQAVVRPGDEVIVFDPAYDSYDPAVTLAGGVAIHLPLVPPSFAIDFQRLSDAVGKRTRLVIINTPHNPTGSVVSAADLDRLADVLETSDCFVLSDEVYEHIVFDGQEHASVVAHPRLAPRSLAVFSFGKTYHATGWKVGYCVAPPRLSEEFRRVHQFNVFTTATPFQWALADFLESDPAHYLELPNFYQAKRDLFADLLGASKFRLLPCGGTYFQLVDYSEVSDQPDTDFATALTTDHGVAAIPISVFCEQPPAAPVVRFCFAKEQGTLVEAAQRLCAI